MLIEAIFTIAKVWKQFRYPTTDKLIKKDIHKDYYSAIKKNEIRLFAKGKNWRSSC
jgi:hypothetical protein